MSKSRYFFNRVTWHHLILTAVIFLYRSSPALAESLMYIDESGNILFADSVSQVPERYRNQVIKQPVFDGDPKTKKVWLEEVARRQQEAENQRKQKEEQLKREQEEAKRRKAEIEKRERDQQKQGFFDRAKSAPKAARAQPPVLVEIPKE